MLQSELAATRAERDAIKLQLAISQNHFDWMRMKLNSLEMEKAALIQKAYGVTVPVPSIERAQQSDPGLDPFSDVGDELAKKLGLPLYKD